MKGATIVDRLRDAAQSSNPELGLIFIDRREKEINYSWKEVYDRALCAAGKLRDLGVKPGDRISIILPTSIQFMDAFFGAQLIGAIPVPMYPPVRLGKLDEYFERSAAMLGSISAKGIISDKRVSRILGKLLALVKPDLGLISAENLHKGTS